MTFPPVMYKLHTVDLLLTPPGSAGVSKDLASHGDSQQLNQPHFLPVRETSER